jgi:hypothetical protein
MQKSFNQQIMTVVLRLQVPFQKEKLCTISTSRHQSTAGAGVLKIKKKRRKIWFYFDGVALSEANLPNT